MTKIGFKACFPISVSDINSILLMKMEFFHDDKFHITNFIFILVSLDFLQYICNFFPQNLHIFEFNVFHFRLKGFNETINDFSFLEGIFLVIFHYLYCFKLQSLDIYVKYSRFPCFYDIQLSVNINPFLKFSNL